MTSPKPDRAAKPAARAAGGRGQQGFGATSVVLLCLACFFAGRFLTLPGQLPPAVGKGVSLSSPHAATTASPAAAEACIPNSGAMPSRRGSCAYAALAALKSLAHTASWVLQPTVVEEPASPAERRSALETGDGGTAVAQQRPPLAGVRRGGRFGKEGHGGRRRG